MRPVAAGSGWSMVDAVCRLGPEDRPEEERFHRSTIALVASGTFRYRTGAGSALLHPGAWLLGNGGACFECGH
jgi:AraC family transcriptional regulator